MLENALFSLVRSTILAGLALRGEAYSDVLVRPIYQPLTVGTPEAPQVTMQVIGNKRYGAARRKVIQPGEGEDMTNQITQWWEATLQIGATARRDPTADGFMALPAASDICKATSDALQDDLGLSTLAASRVRPLRVTDIRHTQFVNESDQYEAMPSFDIVLVHPETLDSLTQPVVFFDPAFYGIDQNGD